MNSDLEDLGPLLVEQFREQLNNLSAAVQLLTPVIRDKGGEQCDPYLAILHQSIYRMLRMLGNLEYLELPEEEQPLRETTLDLAGLCRELAAQVGGVAQQAGVRISYEEETGSLLTRGDSKLLRRMLLGLFANAIRAAGEGGRAGLRLAVRGERAELTVWDSGAGLAPPSAGTGRDLLHRSGGLGLGLRVARRIAAQHGGAIVLEQREERGARAVVSLPLRPSGGSDVLRTPSMGYDAGGGFSDVLVELAGVLPYQAFLPADLD